MADEDPGGPPTAWVPTALLRPTQLAVGLQQVGRKAEEVAEAHGKKKDAQALRKWLEKRPIPYILGPPCEQHAAPDGAAGGAAPPAMFIIDHHHLARALLSLGVHECAVRCVKDLSHLSHEDFWAHMHAEDLIWPHTADGAPLPLPQFRATLPPSPLHLRDDPYRSLAALVRRAKGYDKDWTPFAEFRWANWLRHRVPMSPEQCPSDPQVVAHALRHAALPEAAHLPGYKGAAALAGTGPEEAAAPGGSSS